MCGDDITRSGQLALMDAIIFFVAAVMVSSILLYYSGSVFSTEPQDHGQGTSDPEEVLQTLLRSSVNRDIIVELDVPRHIARDTEIGMCLLLEAEALVDGMEIGAFENLNQAILEDLSALCNPVLDPYLSIQSSHDTGSVTLLALPGSPPDADTRFASSMALVEDEEKDLVVQLVLCPAAPSEIVEVAMGQLDLRAGIFPAAT